MESLSIVMDNILWFAGGMDQVPALRAFLRVVETHSFSKAAAHLGMPRSTVSKLVRDLESHLGTRLIQRTTRSMALTAEGSEYYRRVRRLVARLDDADMALRGMGTGTEGRLRVDVPSSFANYLLIPALPDFQDRYPKIQLAIGINDRPINLIEEGVDCVVRLGNLADTTLVAKRILRDHVVTCASPQYLEQFGTPESPDDLENRHRVVGYFAAHGEPWPLVFKTSSGKREIYGFSVSSNDGTGHLSLLKAGLGVGQLFRSVARQHLESGMLISVLDQWTASQAQFSIVYPPTKRMNARVRVFVDWVMERFSEKSLSRQAES